MSDEPFGLLASLSISVSYTGPGTSPGPGISPFLFSGYLSAVLE